MPLAEPNPRSALYLNLLIEAATDYAIFAMDRERRITMWSKGAERIFGFTESEITGHTADIIFTPEDRALGAPLQEVSDAAHKGRANDERWHLRKNGDRFFASGVMSPLRDEDGTLLGFVKINRDLTAQKLAEQRLEASHDELAHAVEERTRELRESNEALRAEMARRNAAEEARAHLLRRIASSQEQERLRIAREMHDQLGQHVAALMWRLNALEQPLKATPQGPIVAEAQQLVESIGREVHALAVQLRPTVLEDLGLPGAISAYVKIWSGRSKIPVAAKIVNLSESRLPPEIELTLYRIVQEALTNILKHAGATEVQLVVSRLGNEVAVTIEDNGCGFDSQKTEHESDDGLGLLGMRERVAAVDGTLVVESEPGAGTTLFVRVPLSSS